MDTYQLTVTGDGFGTEPPMVYVSKDTAQLDRSGVSTAIFKTKFRGLLLMSSEQVVASAARKGWVQGLIASMQGFVDELTRSVAHTAAAVFSLTDGSVAKYRALPRT